MAITFGDDAVSENIRQLLAQGVGSRDETGVPSFNNADIELHQNIIRRERGLSPISATAPTGSTTVNTMSLNFDGLNSPGMQGMRELTMQIGELEGQKLQISSNIALALQNEPSVVMANEAVAALSDELAMVPLDQVDIRAEIEGDLLQATQLAKAATDDALVRAGIDEKRQLKIIDSDIAKLTAQQKVLNLEQAQQEKILARRGFSDSILRTVVGADLAKDLDQADKLLRSSPPAFADMTRRIATGINSKNYLEAYDVGIDLGGRKAGEDMIVNGAPVEERENVRVALKQNAARMDVNRKLAQDEVRQLSIADPALRTQETKAAKENQIFDGLMRDATFGGYERVLLGTNSDELDASWFNNNQEMLDVGKLIMDLIPEDADNMETAFSTVGQRLLSQGVDRTIMLRAMGKIIDARAASWNTTNRFLGLNVSREKLKTKTQAISANIFNLDRIQQSRLSAANTVAAGSAADIGPLGLFGLSELNQASALGLNTPVPDADAETAAEPGSELDRAPFQAPNRPGVVPSDASRAKLAELAKGITRRAARQAGPPAARQGVPPTGPGAQQTGALTPSAASRLRAEGGVEGKPAGAAKALQDLERGGKITEAKMKAILEAFTGSPEDLQILAEKIADAIRKTPAKKSTTVGVRG